MLFSRRIERNDLAACHSHIHTIKDGAAHRMSDDAIVAYFIFINIVVISAFLLVLDNRRNAYPKNLTGFSRV